jgi:hypothetical protein
MTVPSSTTITEARILPLGTSPKIIHCPIIVKRVVVRRIAKNMGTFTIRKPKKPTAMFATKRVPGRMALTNGKDRVARMRWVVATETGSVETEIGSVGT